MKGSPANAIQPISSPVHGYLLAWPARIGGSARDDRATQNKWSSGALIEGRPCWAAELGCYLPAVPMFVRVAHRRGWEVEVVRPGQPVEKEALASREEALAYAESMEPDWIEVGDIVGLGTSAQRHSWTTLHRQADGTYVQSALRWGGRRLT